MHRDCSWFSRQGAKRKYFSGYSLVNGFLRHVRAMKGNLCGSEPQREFAPEIAIHFSRLHDIDKPTVLVFPKVLVCPHCRAAEFTVAEAELRLLMNGD